MQSCVKEPVLEKMGDISIIGQNDSTIQLGLEIWVNNPNKFPIDLKKMDYEIDMLDTTIGFGTDSSFQSLEAKKSTVLKVQPQIKLKSMAAIFPILVEKEKVDLVISGLYTLELAGKDFKISADKSSSLDLKRQISQFAQSSIQEDAFEIVKVYAPELDLTQRQLKLKSDIAFKNELPIKYMIKSLHLKAFPNYSEGHIGSWQLQKEREVLPGAKEAITVVYTLSQEQVINLISHVRENEFRLNGKAEIEVSGGRFEIPIAQTIEIPLEELAQNIEIPLEELVQKWQPIITEKGQELSSLLLDSIQNYLKSGKSINPLDLLKYLPQKEE